MDLVNREKMVGEVHVIEQPNIKMCELCECDLCNRRRAVDLARSLQRRFGCGLLRTFGGGK
jgi:hypothetical protein